MPRKGVRFTDEERAKISQRTKAAWEEGKLTLRCVEKAHDSVRGRPFTDEHRNNIALALRKAFREGRVKCRQKDPTKWVSVHCSFCGKGLLRPLRQVKRGKWQFCNFQCLGQWRAIYQKGSNNPFYGKKHSEEALRAMFRALNLKPNKLELNLQQLLASHFPEEWEYVGNGRVIIGGLNPDFIHKNGKKVLIEIFGAYWHRPGDGVKRAETFARFGFQTIIVWEHELAETDGLIRKVRAVVDAQ